jgi:hypothetical protein
VKQVVFVVALGLLVVMAVGVVLGFAHMLAEAALHLTEAINPHGK